MHATATHPPSTCRRRVRVDRDRWVSIRPIEAGDADGLSVFYAALSPESRRRRFLAMSAGIQPDLAGRMARIDRSAGDGFVAVLHEPGPRDGAIVDHACMEPMDDGANELAVAVTDDLHGIGLGRELMGHMVESGRRRGVRTLVASLFAENVVMRRLLEGPGYPLRLRGSDGCIQEWELRLPQ